MAEPKTKPTDANVEDYLNTVTPEKKRADSFEILNIMKEITDQQPVMWGPTMIGFDTYHYKYATGNEGDWFKIGFAPRKQALTIYIMQGFEREKGLMEKLGKHKTGIGCLYIKNLEDIDREVLRKLLISSYNYLTEKYG